MTEHIIMVEDLEYLNRLVQEEIDDIKQVMDDVRNVERLPKDEQEEVRDFMGGRSKEKTLNDLGVERDRWEELRDEIDFFADRYRQTDKKERVLVVCPYCEGTGKLDKMHPLSDDQTGGCMVCNRTGQLEAEFIKSL